MSEPKNTSQSISTTKLVSLIKLTPAGKNITSHDIRKDIKNGCPVLPNGEIDLIGYLVWLLKQHGYGVEEIEAD